MTELDQLRAELASVTAAAEEWRQQVLVQDRQIARLTKTKERHKLRLEREAAERTELQAEIDRLRRVHAQVAELLGLQDFGRSEGAHGAQGEPATGRVMPLETRALASGQDDEDSLCPCA